MRIPWTACSCARDPWRRQAAKRPRRRAIDSQVKARVTGKKRARVGGRIPSNDTQKRVHRLQVRYVPFWRQGYLPPKVK